MNPIFKKLNYKAQSPLAILNPPEAFLPHMEEMKELTSIETVLSSESSYEFVLAFAEMSMDLTEIYGQLEGNISSKDPVVWIAYPKKSSKKYRSDIHRDSGHWLLWGNGDLRESGQLP